MTSAQKNSTIATSYDAKGDLLAGTGADAFAKLTVGANGLALVADSSTSTGLKYSTITGPAARVYRATSDQTTTQNVWTKVQLNAETFDTDNCFDPTTNYRFTPTVAGKYLVLVMAYYRQSTSARAIFAVYKNGSSYQRVIDGTNAYTSYTGVGGSTLVDMNGTTDYLEIYGNLTDATTREFNYSTAGADGFSASFNWVRI